MSKIKISLVNHLLDLGEGLHTTSKLACTIGVGVPFMYHCTMLLQFPTIAKMLPDEKNRMIYDALLFILLSINFILFFFFILYATLKAAKVNQKALAFKTIIVNFSQVIVLQILSIYGSILMPLKIFLYLLRLIEIPSIDKEAGIGSIILTCWVIADWLISLVVILISLTYLRSLGGYLGASGVGNSQGSSDVFAKMDGFAEQAIEVGFHCFAILSATSTKYEDTDALFYTFYLVRIVLIVTMNAIYFYELPYFNKYTERLAGHLLFMFTMFFIVLGGTRLDLPLTLKIWFVILPFQVICCEYLLKSSYRSDYLDRSKKKSFKVIKKLLVDGHGNGSIEEKLFDGGILKNYLVSGKNINKQYLQIWKQMVSLKAKQSAKNVEKYKTSESSLLLEDKDTDLLQDNFGSQDLNLEIKKIYNQVDNLILTDYIKEKNRSSYSQLVKILWLLKNDPILSEIYRGLAEMANKRNSTKSILLYHYAKRQVSRTLTRYYYQRDLFLQSGNTKENKRVVKIEQELKKINKVGVDTAYAFWYKDKLEKLVNMINQYISKNKKYIGLLRSQSTSLNEVNDLCIELYQLKNDITMHFEHFHAKTKSIESLHLTPYFYFLISCINLQRSASKIFKLYKQRMLNRKNLIDEKNLEITDVNLFHHSILLMVESNKQKFGTITDIYGDSRYLKIKPDSLKNKHMDCLIPSDMREPHNTSCRIFSETNLSPLIGEMLYSFIKLPERDYILPVGYLIKIMPSIKSEFRYAIGVRYNLIDSNMYILLNKENQIDAFSYNMRYLFKEPDLYLDKNTPLQEICSDLQQKLQRSSKKKVAKKHTQKKVLSNNDSMELTEAKTSTNILEEKKPSAKLAKSKVTDFEDEELSMYKMENQDVDGLDNQEEEEFTRLEFKFRHSGNNSEIVRIFKVKVIDKSFVNTDYNYKVICMIPDDDNMNDWNDEGEQESLQQEDIKSLESHNSLPNIITERVGEGTNLLRSQQETFKFMKEQNQSGTREKDSKNDETSNLLKKQDSMFTEDKKINLGNADSQSSKKDDSKTNQNQGRDDLMSEMNQATPAKENRTNVDLNKSGDTEKMLDMQISNQRGANKDQKDSPRSNESMGYTQRNKKSNRNQQNFSSQGSVENNDEFEDQLEFSDLNKQKKMIDGTGSVFTNSNMQTHKKYYAFEDAVNKKAGFIEILLLVILYLVALVATVLFTVFIQQNLRSKITDFKTQNNILLNLFQHSYEYQSFYSKILRSLAYNKQYIPNDIFERFNFSSRISEFPIAREANFSNQDYGSLNYSLSNFSDYQRMQLKDNTEPNMLQIIAQFYNHVKNLDDTKRQDMFDAKIDFFTHEVNGTKLWNQMSIYQGYVLMTTTKILEVVNKSIEHISIEKKNRETLYFIENSLNGIPLAYMPFTEKLFLDMNTTYEDFTQFTVTSLMIITGLMIVLLTVSTICILLIRQMFKEIYNCYLNITEGELDERNVQLTQISDQLQTFEKTFYFQDFMAFNINDKVKPNTNKPNKKYQNSFYCFKLLLSIFFIILFYLIQIMLSGGLMLILRKNISESLWITNKQIAINKIINNQLFLQNSIMQKIVVGDDIQAMNKTIGSYIDEVTAKVKSESNLILGLQEAGSNYTESTEIRQFLQEVSNTNLCNFTESLQKKQELCHMLDNRIPTKGLVQSYFRTTQYLDSVWTQIKTPDFDATSFLKDNEFMELIYTFENVYLPSFQYVEKNTESLLSKFLEVRINESFNLIVQLIILFVIVSFFFTLFSFMNVNNQINRVVFSYQLLSINTVVNNTAIKYRFLKVYRLNQKHFQNQHKR